MSAKGYWLAFSLGVAAGAAVALLYAPRTGARMRGQLRNTFGDAADYLDDASDYLKAKTERLSQETQTAMKRSKDHVGGAVSAASDAASSALKQAKSLV